MDVLVGRASIVNQQHALEVMKINHILCSIRRSIAGSLRVTTVLLCLALLELHLGCCVEFWAPQGKRHVGKVW